ncbi:MAG TPA: NADH:ubiquinone reductase (Na(+)-transporting) subunit B [Lentisphaeria bacterium]|nr:NADH:ubiquinone reductase (Na(+)-transporting) subunit B [Lentisphaeria bacterium]
MRFIQDAFDKARPLFEKGGKLELLYPLFEAKETFLFVSRERTASGCHVRDSIDSKRYMASVIVALMPCLLFGIYNAGYQYLTGIAPGQPTDIHRCLWEGALRVMPIVICSYAVGGIWELVFSVVRKHEINEGFLVTGLLFPLVLPPTIPLWQVAVGISFGVVIGKEVFGGTGMNIFNPALTARAFLFFAYPAQISGDQVWRVVKDGVDGVSGATPLLVAAAQDGVQVVDRVSGAFGGWSNLFLGLIPGSIGETSTLCCLLGAVYLVATGIGSWRTMLGVLIGAFITCFLLNQACKDNTAINALPFCYHLVSGGFAFGLVFMATDPVSAAQSNTGKWIYGFLIGFLAIVIRTLNPAFPEGMMLAILFMNAFAPLIDYFVISRHMAWRMKRVEA